MDKYLQMQSRGSEIVDILTVYLISISISVIARKSQIDLLINTIFQKLASVYL